MSNRSDPAKECSVTIVIPTYLEAENLRPLVIRISEGMSKATGSYEIIFVDDDSRDGTDRIIGELSDFGYLFGSSLESAKGVLAPRSFAASPKRMARALSAWMLT